MLISDLQKYLKQKDYKPELKQEYFLKLVEETGELANAIRKSAIAKDTTEIKGSVQEEIIDVLYYTVALANCYEMDLTEWFYEKEKLNDIKYGNKGSKLLEMREELLND